MKSGTLPLIEKLAFGTGHILNDLCASVWFSYLLVYLQYVLLLPSGLSGIILLIGQVADAIATPIVGVLSDHGQCCCQRWQNLCNYGKRKIWHLIGSICVMLSFPLMFVGCMGLCESANGVGYLFTFILLVCIFQFGWAAAQISHLAMIPELTPIEAERDELNIIRFAFDIVTDIMVYAIALIIFSQGNSSLAQVTPSSGEDFLILAVSITGIGLLFTVLFHLGVHERDPKQLAIMQGEQEKEFDARPRKKEAAKASSEPRPTLKVQWLAWFKNWHFYRVGLLYTSARLAHNSSIVFVPLYLQETKQSSETLALIPLVMNIAGLVGSGILKITIKHWGKRASYAVSCAMGLTSCVWLIIDTSIAEEAVALIDPSAPVSPSGNADFYVLASLMGGSAAMVVILSLTSAADLIDSNTETSAFVYGCMSFCDKMSSGIFVAIIQGIHSWLCKDGCTFFYAQTLIYGVGVSFILVIMTSCLGPQSPKGYQFVPQQVSEHKDYGTLRQEAMEYVH